MVSDPLARSAKVGRQEVQSANYWSATTNADNPTNAWNVNFNNGNVNNNNKTNTNHAWCVRGEHDAPALFVRESVPAVSPLPATEAEHPQRPPV
jgi:hypothetical protein